ncbi:MAG: PLP-dependent aminotransferase family protein [Clostridia bacterium]|nr:PLP-dependent aminotransferase family protein [Clostridia bacterium]
MKYVIDKNNRPVYLQLYRQIRDDIIQGVYPLGSKLPSKRLLAGELAVSTVTVEHAYALLCDEGYAEARERSGYLVIFRPSDGFAASASVEKTAPTPHAVSSYPEFSVSILSKTIRKVLSDYSSLILEKSPNTGCEALRETICAYLNRNRGIHVSTDQIVIGSGAEYLYGLIVDLLGRNKIYAIETPSYEKIEKIYRAAGLACELLPFSEDGIDSQALAASKADVLHVTPYRSYPTGITASASKRHEYIRWASTGHRFIIESDYGSEFSVSSQPMEPLFVLSECDNVIYLNTFSRTISPSMRIGYMVLPRQLIAPFREKLGFYSCTVPTLEQYVLTELIGSGDFERHINRVRRAKRKELSTQR